MMGEGLASLFERVLDSQDKQRIPARGVTAIEHDPLRGVGSEAADEIAPDSHEAFVRRRRGS
jgi:hypothetical protein